MNAWPSECRHEPWFFFRQQIAITLVVEFVLLHFGAWIRIRNLIVNREVEDLTQERKLVIDCCRAADLFSPRDRFPSIPFDVLNQQRRHLTESLAAKIVADGPVAKYVVSPRTLICFRP